MLEKKNNYPWPLLLLAFIIGRGLYKQIEIDPFRFKQPAIATIYLVSSVALVVFMVWRWRKKE